MSRASPSTLVTTAAAPTQSDRAAMLYTPVVKSAKAVRKAPTRAEAIIRDALRRITRALQQNPELLCGGVGCMRASGKGVATKVFVDKDAAWKENKINGVLKRKLGIELLERFTMLTVASVKKTRGGICRTPSAKHQQLLVDMVKKKHGEKSFVDDRGNLCTLKYKLANSDVSKLLKVCWGCGAENVKTLLCSMVLAINDEFFAVMHENGMYHMDIKTENLVMLLTDVPQMRVIDFGLMVDVDVDDVERNFPLHGTSSVMSPVVLYINSRDRHPEWGLDDVESDRFEIRLGRVLERYWKASYGSVIDLWGDKIAYIAMVRDVVRRLDRVRYDRAGARYLLKKHDDYGVALTCIEICGGDVPARLRARLRSLLEYVLPADVRVATVAPVWRATL